MPALEFQIIANLLTVVNGLQTHVTGQGEAAAKPEEINKELPARLNTNSRNSSQPPSVDGYSGPSAKAHDSDPTSEVSPKDDKPSPKSLRQKSSRKPGGQKCHKGTMLQQVTEADHTRCRPVIESERFYKPLRSVEPVRLIERQVFKLGRFGHFEVAAFVAEVKKCDCGHVTHASFIKGIDSHVQYGSVTKSLAVCLFLYQLMPSKCAYQFFMDILRLEVSLGSVCTFQENAYDQLAITEQAIADALKGEPVTVAR